VFEAVAAAAAVAAGLRCDARTFASALGIAGSMASGIIEYLAEGTWTKRLHAGWAGHSGYRAARLAAAGFVGPRTVLEGRHGLLHAFTRGAKCDWDQLTSGFGACWVSETIAFKPYPCGTMAHPYIDCALRLRAGGLRADDIESIVCETAEGFVHRLWEPLADKQQPANGYAGKFSIPYVVAAALVHGEVGLATFEDGAVADPAVRRLARKVCYVVDPEHPYPRTYTGHVAAKLRDGSVREERQPHLRGGAAEPLTAEAIARKFDANVRHGGWSEAEAARIRAWAGELFAAPAVLLCVLGGERR
jgi:2-methylcitrate dehydratase PrpD